MQPGAPGQAPVYGRPVPAPKKSNQPLIIGIVGGAVALLLLCLGGLYLIGSQEQQQNASSPNAGVTSAAALLPDAQVTTPAPAEVSSSPAAPTTAAPTGPKSVAMPSVTGENAAVADDKLRKLGFTNIQYGSQDEDDTFVLLLSNWTVTKQSTKPGTKIKTDTLIVLACTKQG